MGQTAAYILYHFALNSFMAARYATENCFVTCNGFKDTRLRINLQNEGLTVNYE